MNTGLVSKKEGHFHQSDFVRFTYCYNICDKIWLTYYYNKETRNLNITQIMRRQ